MPTSELNSILLLRIWKSFLLAESLALTFTLDVHNDRFKALSYMERT